MRMPPRRWMQLLAVVVVVASGAGCSASTPSGGPSTPAPSVAPAAGQPTRSAVWVGLRFQYPAGWQLHDYEIVSHGPGQFGPFLGNRPLVDPCATSQTDQGTEFSCPNSPVSAPLDDGGGYAQWTDSYSMGRPQPAHSHSFGSPLIRTAPAAADCRASGGTTTITATIAATARTSYTLRGCFNGGPSSEFDRAFRQIATSARSTG